MSVRNMLKVVMSLLLAMTIAATADTHAARVDRSPASVSAVGKLNDRMPYLLCQRFCTGVCTCDKRPVQFAKCTCSRPGDSTNSNKPAALPHTSEETVQVKGKSENSGAIPYTECMKTCSKCACTLMWPPERNMCICLEHDSMPKKATTVVDRLDQSLASITGQTLHVKGKLENSGAIPYTECMKTCSKCACTLMWPPERNMCICLEHDSVPKKATAVADRLDQSLVSVTRQTLHVTGKLENSGAIPYTECMKTCSKCACTLMWPPERNMCICLEHDNVPKKATTVVDRLDQSLASVTGQTLHVKEKLENSGAIPYTECMKTCSKCACTLMWPPERNMCICLEHDSVPKKATIVVDRLDQSLASVTEKVNELYEKLDLLAGPVPERTGGDDKKMVLWTTSKIEATIPYTECINTCETCVCTLIWPPEAAICICITPKPHAAGGKAVAK